MAISANIRYAIFAGVVLLTHATHASAAIPIPTPSPFSKTSQNQNLEKPESSKPESSKPQALKDQNIPKSHEEAVARIDKKLNANKTITADFMQISQDGKKSYGKLYILRPGRFLFKYDSPSTLELIADGRSLAIRDKRLGTQDIYPLSQTPLRFLSRDKIQLEKDTKVLSSSIENEMLLIKLQESSTLGGNSKITLYFDINNDDLLQWTVIDPQGFETNVVLNNLDYKSAPNPNMFYIETAQNR